MKSLLLWDKTYFLWLKLYCSALNSLSLTTTFSSNHGDPGPLAITIFSKPPKSTASTTNVSTCITNSQLQYSQIVLYENLLTFGLLLHQELLNIGKRHTICSYWQVHYNNNPCWFCENLVNVVNECVLPCLLNVVSKHILTCPLLWPVRVFRKCSLWMCSYLSSLEALPVVEVEMSSPCVWIPAIKCDKHVRLCPRIHLLITGKHLDLIRKHWKHKSPSH